MEKVQMDRYKFFRGFSGDFISTRLRSSCNPHETKNLFGKRKHCSDGDVQDGLDPKYAVENQPKSTSSSNPIIATVENMGNTCYVNAVIFYSLRFIPMFTNKLHDLVLNSGDLITIKSKLEDSSELKLLRALHRNFLNMSQNECKNRKCRKPIKPSTFLWAMRDVLPEFKDKTQHDPAELLIKLLELLEKCCDDLERVSAEDRLADEASKLKSMCFYGDYFKGQETKSITCSTCQTVNINCIATSVITVTVPTNSTKETPAHWIAESLLSPEMLEEFKCERCEKVTTAKQGSAYPTLPKILIFHLKFVDENLAGGSTKVTGHIPMQLELDCFCHSCQKGDPNPEHKYHLNAIVVHIGRNCSTGHYIAFVRPLLGPDVKGSTQMQKNCCQVNFNPFDKNGNLNNVWLKCNDNFINVFDWTAMQRFFKDNKYRSPHILFYARNDMVVERPSQ